MAPPTTPTTVIDLVSSDSEDGTELPAPQPAPSVPAMQFFDLTLTPSPPPETNVSRPEASESRSARKARSSLLIQSRTSSSKFQIPKKPIGGFKNPSGPLSSPIDKFKSPSASQGQNDTTKALPNQADRASNTPPKQRNLGIEVEEEEDVVDNEEDPVPSDPERAPKIPAISRILGVGFEDGEEDDEQGNVSGDDTPSKRSRGRPRSRKSSSLSVGTDSPIATRYRQRNERAYNGNEGHRRDESPRDTLARLSPSTAEQLPLQDSQMLDLETSLQQLHHKMLNNHGETVRWLLFDAKRNSERTQSAFMDQVSPFASMQPIDIPPSEPVPEGTSRLRLNIHPKKIKKYARKGGIHLITTKVAGDAPRVPRYNSNTIVKRNILCGDEDKLQFIPFLANPAGETDQGSLLADLGEVYSTKPSGFSKESERALEIRNYVDDWLEGLDVGCNRQTLIRYLIEKSTDDLGKNHKLRRLEKSFGGPLAPTLVEVAKRISDAFDKILGVSLKDVILPEKCLKQIIENAEKTCPDGSLGRSQSESPKSQFNRTEYTVERLGTFINLTCLICGVVSCQTHGDYTKVDDEYQPTYVAMRYDELLRSQDARLSWNSPATVRTQPSSVESSPCSDLCYRKDCYRMPVELAREHEIALKSFMISMRPNVEQPCSISFLLDVPCWQIHSKIQEWNAAPKVAPKDPTLTRSRGPRGIDWYDNKQKTLKPDWRELTTAHQHEERVQANPCAHDGPCRGEDCPCAGSNILCEMYCACADDCSRKFTGCSCHGSGITCVSETCICIAMSRECGPQCMSCGAGPRINPRNKYDDDLFARGCQNVALQRGVTPKFLIGESQLEGTGFGLYLGQAVRKGDYLGDYAGEIISYEEADRRGILYDLKYLSFLFDINSGWCIDAALLGNKTRFINHADNEKDGMNCEARIMLVNGEHKIKFVALRDIASGEELLFNYGKKFADKHGLSKKLPGAKDGAKKGVVVGEEALNALDGFRTRGRYTAIRGGHGSGRGGRKATKAAPMRSAAALSELVEQTIDEDESTFDTDQVEEENDDEEDGEDGRVKRPIKRPKRYTKY